MDIGHPGRMEWSIDLQCAVLPMLIPVLYIPILTSLLLLLPHARSVTHETKVLARYPIVLRRELVRTDSPAVATLVTIIHIPHYLTFKSCCC